MGCPLINFFYQIAPYLPLKILKHLLFLLKSHDLTAKCLILQCIKQGAQLAKKNAVLGWLCCWLTLKKFHDFGRYHHKKHSQNLHFSFQNKHFLYFKISAPYFAWFCPLFSNDFFLSKCPFSAPYFHFKLLTNNLSLCYSVQLAPYFKGLPLNKGFLKQFFFQSKSRFKYIMSYLLYESQSFFKSLCSYFRKWPLWY